MARTEDLAVDDRSWEDEAQDVDALDDLDHGRAAVGQEGDVEGKNRGEAGAGDQEEGEKVQGVHGGWCIG